MAFAQIYICSVHGEVDGWEYESIDTERDDVEFVMLCEKCNREVKALTHEGKPVVLKCYGRKERPVRVALRQFGSLFIVGKSSITPGARCKTEHDVINLWRREGFDVPSLLAVPVPDPDLEPCLAMEWIPGTTLARVLLDSGVPVSRKQDLINRFTVILGRRHARAMSLKEPRLLFENPTFDHVFLSGERLVHHDFEIVFTGKRNIERLVRREIVGFLCSLAKVTSCFRPFVQLAALAEPGL